MFKSQETSVTLIPAYPASLREKRRSSKNGPGVLAAVIDQRCISDPLSALGALSLPHDPHHSLVSHHWGMGVSGHYRLTLGSFCSITLSTRLPWALSFSLWHQIRLWNLCNDLNHRTIRINFKSSASVLETVNLSIWSAHLYKWNLLPASHPYPPFLSRSCSLGLDLMNMIYFDFNLDAL